ncbi:arabinogalactan oligomer / maltooligosaccharide transport system permease protein [Stigmatella aurantiaca]|uniref:Arabinogalactan oligomer / maltooligosaccharide transport system permease protein n=1 Tax=Stigmatella aurantiaca TaxID=41 RepID=A0A1H8BFK9_STIAU|nr:arabinogalactan oligomer / maltooligosaccharide transport system permease protein [Stigmatella aurantiaca]
MSTAAPQGGPAQAPRSPASPPAVGPDLNPPEKTSSGLRRPRVLVGLALALALGLFVAHGLLARAREDASLEREQRRALISLRALTELVQRAGGSGDAVRAAVASWQDQLPAGSAVRVVAFSGIRLEASTFPEDQGDKAAPRRLSREEKPLYDRGQRLRTSVETNREESGARKQELEAEGLPGGGRLISAPVEVEGTVVGMVELATPPLPKVEPPGLVPALLAFLLPLLLVAAVGFAPLRRQWQLTAVAAVAFLGGMGAYAAHSLTSLEDAVRGSQQAVADQLEAMTGRARTVMEAQGLPAEPPLTPGTWDADLFRRPLGLLTAQGQVNTPMVDARVERQRGEAQQALFGLGGVGLALVLLIGLGGVHRLAHTVKENRQAYAYIAPAMLGMLVLIFFPFFYGITLSFTDANLYNSNQALADIWIGLRNYQDILGDFSIAHRGEEGQWVFNYLNFYWTLMFTVVWTVTNVTIGVTVGLTLALILNTPKLALRPIYRVLLILPWAMPNYITALIWKGMFHQQFGVVNHVIRMFGGQGLSWFESPFTSFFTALATNGWLSFPFMMVVSLGALQSIPAELYEAARVDGASRWEQFRAITLPSLKPALMPAVILSVVWTFNMFNIIFLVTEGEPGNSTEILVTQAYKYAFQRYRYGYAAAYSTVIFGILLLYSVVQNRITRATEAT